VGDLARAAGDPLRPAAQRGALEGEAELATPAPSDALARLLGHDFARPALLAEALTHPSALVPHPARGRRTPPPRGYERLEFLGDRVLGLVVADLLWRRFPREPEGDLTKRLTHLVRGEALARVAAAIGLEHHLTLSRAEAAAGTARNPAILADVCEAVIAAIYLDAGYEAAAAFIHRWWAPLLAEMDRPPRDPKTSLQEWAQARGLALPSYDLVATDGPDHARRFTVAARLAGHDEALATASSKRAAEAGAAALLLARLTRAGPA
jgi:ribonuclease-3